MSSCLFRSRRFFVCQSVRPFISGALSVRLSGWGDNNLFYIPAVSFLLDPGPGRTPIHQRQRLIGLWSSLLYGGDVSAISFPVQPSVLLSGCPDGGAEPLL